jgi:hypothetical protein
MKNQEYYYAFQAVTSCQTVMKFCVGAFSNAWYEFGCYWSVKIGTLLEQFF